MCVYVQGVIAQWVTSYRCNQAQQLPPRNSTSTHARTCTYTSTHTCVCTYTYTHTYTQHAAHLYSGSVATLRASGTWPLDSKNRATLFNCEGKGQSEKDKRASAYGITDLTYQLVFFFA